MTGNKKRPHFEVCPVMLTPFQKNNEIDFEALRQLTEFYIATGSTGLFANCLSSEMFQLTGEERIQITRTVVRQVEGRQQVVATGNFGYDQDKNIDFIKKIYDTGVHAVILNTNQLATQAEPEEVWKKNSDKILDATGNIHLGIYECPVSYKRLLSPELAKWLGETGRFTFFKDTSCNLDKIKNKLKAVRGTSLRIFNANIPTGLDSIHAGAKGLASIASNFYPELLRYLAENADSESPDMSKVNTFLIDSDPLIHEFYPMSARFFLKLRGMKINSNTRVPVGDFTYQHRMKFDQLFRRFEMMAEELGIEVYRF